MAGTEGPPPTEESGDRQLLAAHVAGDPDAFGTLFARHRDRLWAVALRTTGNPEEAADALQDGLISAFRKAGTYRGDAAVTTWLHRIVVNACLDRLRREKVRETRPLPDVPDGDRAGAANPAPGTGGRSGSREVADPADLVLDEEQRSLVTRALTMLPLEQRAALVLVDMQGFSVDEAAAVLDCAPGTVKSRCSRGRARLAPLLSDLLGHAGEPDRPPTRPNPGGSGGEHR